MVDDVTCVVLFLGGFKLNPSDPVNPTHGPSGLGSPAWSRNCAISLKKLVATLPKCTSVLKESPGEDHELEYQETKVAVRGHSEQGSCGEAECG